MSDNFKSGDKVTINNQKLQHLYGIKDTSEFEVEDQINDKVYLKNGWTLKTEHVNRVVSTPVSVFELYDSVDQKLSDFIDDDKAFTAFDVTRSLRDENPNEDIRHYKVKEIVHEIMLNIDSYERKLIDVGTPIKPWLYYPEGYDPDTYRVGNGAQLLGNYKDNAVKAQKPGVIHKFLSKFGLRK